MEINIRARGGGRRLAQEAAMRTALQAGLRVAEAAPGGRLYAVHLGAGDQLVREPIAERPPARIFLDELPR